MLLSQLFARHPAGVINNQAEGSSALRLRKIFDPKLRARYRTTIPYHHTSLLEQITITRVCLCASFSFANKNCPSIHKMNRMLATSAKKSKEGECGELESWKTREEPKENAARRGECLRGSFVSVGCGG